MSDWQIGDLAVCVDDSKQPVRVLVKGAAYRIAKILTAGGLGHLNDDLVPFSFLLAEVQPPFPHVGFDPRRFRKIRPDAHEGNIEDWRDLVEFFTKRVNA